MWKVPCDSQYHTAVPTRHNCTQSDQRSAHSGHKIRSLGPGTIFLSKSFHLRSLSHLNGLHTHSLWIFVVQPDFTWTHEREVFILQIKTESAKTKWMVHMTLVYSKGVSIFLSCCVGKLEEKERFWLLRREIMNPVIWALDNRRESYSPPPTSEYWLPIFWKRWKCILGSRENFEDYSHLDQLGPFLILALFV